MAGARAVFCDGGADDAAHPGGRGSGPAFAQTRRNSAPKVDIDHSAVLAPATDRSILALDEALAAFSELAPRQAKVVELRYFGGLTEEEIVAALKISPRTVRRDWDLAKAWLLRELSHSKKRATNSP